MAEPQNTSIAGLYADMRKWVSGESGQTAVRGGAWSFAGYTAGQVLRLGSTLVLARMLAPEAFGLVGLVMVFLTGLAMFSELGIQANVIQHRRGDESLFLNTAFSVQAARGLAIWVVAALLAYPFAAFYALPELLPLLGLAATSELIRGLTSTRVWTLTRHVRLGRITVLSIVAELAGFGVGVLWAWLEPSAWALVARTVAQALVFAVGSHLVAQPPVRFGWERDAARQILHFGGWISVATAMFFLGVQTERLALGKFITPAELGCFSLAFAISSIPSGGINQLMSQVFFPMLASSVRKDIQSTARNFQTARYWFMGLGLFAGLGFILLSRPFVKLALRPEYSMTGWMLQLLGIRAALDIFAAPASNLIIACGKPKYSALANTVRFVLMGCGLWFTIARLGLVEAILALVLAQAISYLALLPGLQKLLRQPVRQELVWYFVFLFLLGMAAWVWAQQPSM